MTANDAVGGVNVIDVAAEAVVANDDDIALFAQLEVPNNAPVNEPVNEPVLICEELDTNPLGLLVIVSHVLAAPDTYDAVTANDAVIELLAQLAVPNMEPL